MKREPTEPQGFIKPTGVGIPRLQAGEEVNASSPVCAVLGLLFFAAFITLAVIAIVACVMAAFDRDVDRLLHAAIVVAIMAIPLAVTWGLVG